MNRIVVLTIAVISALFVVTPKALADGAAEYTFITINYPKAQQTWPLAINNSGDVAGTAFVEKEGKWVPQGFIRNKGNFTAISPPKAIQAAAGGINDSGKVAGQYSYRDKGGVHNISFVYDKANKKSPYISFEYDDSPCGTNANGINNSGEVAGYFCDGDDYEHGFKRDATGKLTQWDNPLSTSNTIVNQINDSGDMTGLYVGDSGTTGFAYIGEQNYNLSIQDAANPSDISSWGINNAAQPQVAGSYLAASGAYHGFVYDSGSQTYTIVDYPNSSITTLYGINDNGQVTGIFQDMFSNGHGFIATPGQPNSISGTVISAVTGGDPLPGIIVSLAGPTIQSVQTDSGGNFTFTGLAKGTYTVSASIKPVKGYKANVTAKISGQDMPANFYGTALYWVTGSVIDIFSSPITGATVKVTNGKKVVASATTDAAGNFSISGLPGGGPYVISAVKKGYTFIPLVQTLNENIIGYRFAPN